MKKIKKLGIFFAVGLALFSAVAGSLPFFGVGVASADNLLISPTPRWKSGTWWDQATTRERVELGMMIQAIAKCVEDDKGGDQISSSAGTDGKWFSNGETYPGVNLTKQGGYGSSDSADGGDGKVSCKDGEGIKFVNDFVDRLSDTGVVSAGLGDSAADGDAYKTACFLGWHTDDKSQFEDSKGCATSNSKLWQPRSGDFIKYVTNALSGYSASNVYALFQGAEWYFHYSSAFASYCLGEGAKQLGVYQGTEQADIEATRKLDDNFKDGDSNYYGVKVINPDYSVTTYVYEGQHDRKDEPNIGVDTGLGISNSLNCEQLNRNAGDRINDAIAYVKENPEQGDAVINLGGGAGGALLDGSGVGAIGDLEIECATGFSNILTNPIDWLTCAVVQGLFDFSKGLESVITGMLCINETDIFEGAKLTCSEEAGKSSSQEGFYNAWNVFRILALAFIAIAGLVMVISQGLGFEIVDAYTVKKVLPRLIIAGIFISLSWPLLEFLVTLSNALGIGVRNLIYSPFRSIELDGDFVSIGDIGLGTLFAGAAFKAIGALGLLSFIATAALALLVAFFVLVLRGILVILLVVMAPLAIAMYVLPNTEKYWKIWWDWLFKALMVFPIITAMIAFGHVFAAITLQKDGSLSTFVALAAYFAPYFLIPAAFRFAGGALATIGGFANDRSRGAFDRLSKFRKGQTDKRLGYYGNKYGNRATALRARAVDSLNHSADSSGAVGQFARRRAARFIAPLGGIDEALSERQAHTSKRINDAIATGRDGEVHGLTVNKKKIDRMGFAAAERDGLVRTGEHGQRQYKSLSGHWINESDVINGQKEFKGDRFAQQAALSYAMRKAGSENDVEGIKTRYKELAMDQWGMSEGEAGEAWIGSAFENQNQHLAFKDTAWKTGNLKTKGQSQGMRGNQVVDASGLQGSGLVDEIYEKRGSYNMAQMHSSTVKSLQEAYRSSERVLAGQDHEGNGGVTYTDAQRAAARDQQEKIQGIAQTFMSEFAGGQQVGAVGEDKIPLDSQGQPTRRQANTPGSAHTAERVRELATMTGVYRQAPGGNYANPQDRDAPHPREQS